MLYVSGTANFSPVRRFVDRLWNRSGLTSEKKKMRIFQRYNPMKVAKYVKILFRGRLYIKDVGAFEFDQGKILSQK